MKQSIRKAQLIGTLSEINLQIENDKEMTLDSGAKIKCKVVTKANLQEPALSIMVNDSIVGIDLFPCYEKNKDGTDNPKFKARCTMIEKYVAKETRLKIDGVLGLQEYAKDDEWKSFMSITAFQVTSANVPEEDMAECSLTGIINNIVIETKKEEETGRLLVEFCCFDQNSTVIPLKLVVEKDLAEDFLDSYEIGTSCQLDVEAVTKGGVVVKKSTSKALGRRESKIVSGNSFTEYSVFSGEEPFDEDSDYFITAEELQQALNERDITIKEKIKEKKDKVAQNSNFNTTPKKTGLAGRKKTAIGASTETTNDDKKTDCPF